MSAPRYETNGTWYKGNTHIHSTASDGGRTCTELARMYADVGYDFLFCTDHYVASDVGSDTEDYPLLWLDGIELDGTDYGGSPYHVICLGTFAGITREMGLVAAMEAARAQDGFRILAHPHWTTLTFFPSILAGTGGGSWSTPHTAPGRPSCTPSLFKKGHSDGTPSLFKKGHSDGTPSLFKKGHSDGTPSVRETFIRPAVPSSTPSNTAGPASP
jgi:hypothetical protein